MESVTGGFAVAMAELASLALGWQETAIVIRDCADDVRAPGAWPLRVAGPLTAFTSTWRQDLAALAGTADDVAERLTDTAETYLGVDTTARRYLEAVGG